MEEVIKKIIKIEATAQEIMAKTAQENKVKRAEAQARMVELEEKILGDAQRKVKEIKKAELRKNAVVAKEIGKESERLISKMEEKAVANEEAWVAYLVDRVLGD